MWETGASTLQAPWRPVGTEEGGKGREQGRGRADRADREQMLAPLIRGERDSI